MAEKSLRYIPEKIKRIKPVAIFPTREIPVSASAIRDWGQGAEEIGFEAALIYHHTAMTAEDDGNNHYTVADPHHQPFVLGTGLAYVTDKLDIMTGVVVAPLMQTPDLAASAAQVANLSGGRMHLGVGTGANAKEYAAYGKNFNRRGKKLEQQVNDLRDLWKGNFVDHSDNGEPINDPYVIRPLPEHEIPIWMGGWEPKVLERVARQADGWMPMGHPNDVEEGIDFLRDRLVENNRDPYAFPIMGAMGRRYSTDGSQKRSPTTPADWPGAIQAAFDMGLSHVAHGTMTHNHGENVDKHLAELQEWMDVFKSYQPPQDK
jgi:probable F420-dependent oxidoreductase